MLVFSVRDRGIAKTMIVHYSCKLCSIAGIKKPEEHTRQ